MPHILRLDAGNARVIRLRESRQTEVLANAFVHDLTAACEQRVAGDLIVHIEEEFAFLGLRLQEGQQVLGIHLAGVEWQRRWQYSPAQGW